MGHELRTPLTGIRGFAELIERHAATTPWAEPAYRIRRNAERLTDLLNNLLDMSRLEAGAIQLNWAAEPVRALAAETLELFDAAAAIKDLALILDDAEPLPEQLLCDGMRLRQILTNLLSNAVKFTASGRVTLRLRREGDWLRFEVIDTGPGIAPELHAPIFERFRQADGSIASKHGGAGLGLSLARDLAQVMGGTLTVASTPDAGATFSLSLPIRLAAPNSA